MAPKFIISLEPLNEPDRKHWCSVIGCQDTVLFYDEKEDCWVCWPHGSLKLREDHQWWTHEPLDAVVRSILPCGCEADNKFCIGTCNSPVKIIAWVCDPPIKTKLRSKNTLDMSVWEARAAKMVPGGGKVTNERS